MNTVLGAHHRATFWVLFALHSACTLLFAMWAFLGLFSLHDGWTSAIISLGLVFVAFLMVKVGFEAQAEKSWGEVRKANRMLGASSLVALAVFTSYSYLVGVWE